MCLQGVLLDQHRWTFEGVYLTNGKLIQLDPLEAFASSCVKRFQVLVGPVEC